jgi:ring-1,2-phenylacetyl-CoA epoxidase subunit PaaE
MSLGAPQFHRLEIADVKRETADAVSLAFAVPAELREAYRFAQGQHVTLKMTIDGAEVRRSYSVCSGVGEDDLRIAIKKQPGGVFSTFANERLTAGEWVDVMTPTGHFTSPLDAEAERTYLGVAVGSGITPLLSIVKTVLQDEPKSRVFLLYGNRTAQSIMFREALEDLKDRFLNRFSLTHVLSGEAQDAPALSGRIDADKLAVYLRCVIGPVGIDHAFICGPPALLDAAERVLEATDAPPAQIHVERFTVDGAVAVRRAQPPTQTTPRRIVAQAEAVLDGIRHRFPIGAEETIIDAALTAGLDLPYSCRGGMCCTCRARLVEGEVAMDQNYSLERWELDAGYVLTCQSRPKTATLIIDYDQI